MQIVIPMSGQGSRFQRAGYTRPKPLIEVDGKPIIEHIVNLFPGERDFLFICSEEHLATTDMEAVLRRISPEGKIIGIGPHKKGPVFAVAEAFGELREDAEIIVNYCDFAMGWDYADFLRHTRARAADGALACYRGFHPHMLGSDNYAFVRDVKQWLLEIKEKAPFTANRMGEYASSGTYYFKSGALVKRYFAQLMQEGIALNGEYYVSLVYNLLARDGLKTSIYEIPHMLQWGTPGDLEEYNKWSHYFRRVIAPHGSAHAEPGSVNLIPLAGRGSRFSAVGYRDPKPLIPVSGKPMILQAAEALPPAENHVFVALGEHLRSYPLKQAITGAYPRASILALDEVTQGQACTVELGLAGVAEDAPLLVGACDNAMLYDAVGYEALRESSDAIIFTFRHHVSVRRNPQMYGYVKLDGQGLAAGVSVKKPISDHPEEDHAIVGAFYFRQARYFREAFASLLAKDERVNGEFYVDSLIGELVAQGRKVAVFEVTDYVCFGTPDDLDTFAYWQGFFHTCPWHPYDVTRDPTVNQQQAALLVKSFEQGGQPYE